MLYAIMFGGGLLLGVIWGFYIGRVVELKNCSKINLKEIRDTFDAVDSLLKKYKENKDVDYLSESDGPDLINEGDK